MRAVHSLEVDVWVVPRFFELGLNGPRAETDDVWGVPFTKAPRLALRSHEWRLKRIFDVVVSARRPRRVAPVLVIDRRSGEAEQPRPGLLPPAAGRAGRSARRAS